MKLVKFIAQLCNNFETMINSVQIPEIWTKTHQRAFGFFISEKEGHKHSIKIAFMRNLFIVKNQNFLFFFPSDKIFQTNERFPLVFCHFLFITLVRTLTFLSCTGPGREYCPQHSLTDALRAFQVDMQVTYQRTSSPCIL